MATSLPDLSRSDIRAWAPDRFFERGETYAEQDRVRHLHRTGRTLRAECEGSRPEPYLVEVTLGEFGIRSYDCTCPVNGRCKHLVALLLTWIDTSDEVPTKAALEERLHRQSADTLVDIIMEMIQWHPDLRTIAEMAADDGTGVDPDQIRRRIQSTFEDALHANYAYDNPYQHSAALIRDLKLVLNRGHSLVDDERYGDAAAVFCAFIDVGCEHYTKFPDEEGQLARLFDEAAEQLDGILDETDAPEPRRSILGTLMDLVLADIRFGGYGLGDDPRHIVLNHSAGEERRRLAERVEAAIDALVGDAKDDGDASTQRVGEAGSWSTSAWKAEALGGLLLDLEDDELGDDAYLAICKKTGRHADRTKRLFELDRPEEAQDVARELSDYRLYRLAGVFREHEATDLYRGVVDERLDTDLDARLLRWRRDDAMGQDDRELALELTRRLFWSGGAGIEEYETLRSIANDLGRWEEVQSEVHRRARGQRTPNLLARLHVSDGDIREAVELAKEGAIRRDIQMKVAEAAEDADPEAAIALYQREARTLIERRGRGNYAEAAGRMEQAKAVYESLGDDDGWDRAIKQLFQDELHRLPAARDEFQKAGLLTNA